MIIEEWKDSRIVGLLKYISKDYFKGKTLLELVAGHGDIGNQMYELGCNVTCSDSINDHLKVINKKYPHLNTKYIDCDVDKIEDHYDIILHWGLLYTLQSSIENLQNCCEKCNVLLLETEVIDSLEDRFTTSVEVIGHKQAFNSYECRPSPQHVENILSRCGFNTFLVIDKILNAEFHVYDWAHQNSNRYMTGLRRYWICWSNRILPPLKLLSMYNEASEVEELSK